MFKRSFIYEIKFFIVFYDKFFNKIIDKYTCQWYYCDKHTCHEIQENKMIKKITLFL